MFRDSAGVMWVRRLDGDLSELGAADPDQRAQDEG
jgi:hypothetical protein